MSELAHLRVYRFEPGAAFEGGLLAAIERMQVGDGAKLLDALFVRRGAASGALDAVDLAAGGADATFASLLDFRLDPGRRHSITERTLAEHPGWCPVLADRGDRSHAQGRRRDLRRPLQARHRDGTRGRRGALWRPADRRRAGRCARTRGARPAAAPGRRLPAPDT